MVTAVMGGKILGLIEGDKYAELRGKTAEKDNYKSYAANGTFYICIDGEKKIYVFDGDTKNWVEY